MKQTNNPTDLRKWYGKKRFLIPVISFAALLIIGVLADENEKSTPVEDVKKSEVKPDVDSKTKLQNTIESLRNDDLTKTPHTSVDDFVISEAIFKTYAASIAEYKTNTDPEVIALVKDLEKKLSASQVKNYPKLRKAYFEMIKPKFWEEDIYVGLAGKGNTTLKLTGSVFVTNKNIKASQETLHEMFKMLRFKKVEYRWHKEQDEFTYYTVASENDEVIVQ